MLYGGIKLIIDKSPIIISVTAMATYHSLMQMMIDLNILNELCEVIIVSLARKYRGRDDLIDTPIFEFAEWVEDTHNLEPLPGHQFAFDWELLALLVRDILLHIAPIFQNRYWIECEIEGLVHLNNRLLKVIFVRTADNYML